MGNYYGLVLKKTVIDERTIEVTRRLGGWFVYVIDNSMNMAIWGRKCSDRAQAFERYDTIVNKYKSGC